jgi:hypothetical protein
MADPEVPIPKDLDWWNRLRRQEQQGQPGVPPTPLPDPKSPEAMSSALAASQTHYAPTPNPTMDMVGRLLNQPSWADRAGAQSAKEQEAFRQGGGHALINMDPTPNMDLAGGFAGTFAGIRDPYVFGLLKRAEGMGATPQDLWSNYKAFRGLDTKFRQYIPDDKMGIAPGFRDPAPLGVPPLTHVSGVPLQRMIAHPELFESLPELKGVMTDISKGKGQWGGLFSPPRDGSTGQLNVQGSNEKTLRELLAHEIQHGAQDVGGLEGTLAPGENKSALEATYMRNLLKQYKRIDKVPAPLRNEAAGRAWRDYQGNLGETEARMSGSLASTPSADVNLDTLSSILYNPTRMPTGRNVPWSWYQQQTPDVKAALRGSGVRALKASEQ